MKGGQSGNMAASQRNEPEQIMSNSTPAQQGGAQTPAPQQGQQQGSTQQQQGQGQPIFKDWAAI